MSQNLWKVGYVHVRILCLGGGSGVLDPNLTCLTAEHSSRSTETAGRLLVAATAGVLSYWSWCRRRRLSQHFARSSQPATYTATTSTEIRNSRSSTVQPANQNGKRLLQKSIKTSEDRVGLDPQRLRSIVMP